MCQYSKPWEVKLYLSDLIWLSGFIFSIHMCAWYWASSLTPSQKVNCSTLIFHITMAVSVIVLTAYWPEMCLKSTNLQNLLLPGSSKWITYCTTTMSLQANCIIISLIRFYVVIVILFWIVICLDLGTKTDYLFQGKGSWLKCNLLSH